MPTKHPDISELRLGGRREKKIVARLRSALAGGVLDKSDGAESPAIQYERTIGLYYRLYPVKPSRLQDITNPQDYPLNTTLAWCYKLHLQGTVAIESDFKIEYLDTRKRQDGTLCYVVRLTGVTGARSRSLDLDDDALSTPGKFRVWLTSKGPFIFCGGVRALNALKGDLAEAEIDLQNHSCTQFDPSTFKNPAPDKVPF